MFRIAYIFLMVFSLYSYSEPSELDLGKALIKCGAHYGAFSIMLQNDSIKSDHYKITSGAYIRAGALYLSNAGYKAKEYGSKIYEEHLNFTLLINQNNNDNPSDTNAFMFDTCSQMKLLVDQLNSDIDEYIFKK